MPSGRLLHRCRGLVEQILILIEHQRRVDRGHILRLMVLDEASAHVLTSFTGNDALPAKIMDATPAHIVHLVVG